MRAYVLLDVSYLLLYIIDTWKTGAKFARLNDSGARQSQPPPQS